MKVDIVPTSYRAIIENNYLKIFISAKWVEKNSINKSRERQVKECVHKRCENETDGENLYLVDEAIKKVAMRMQFTEAEEGVWALRMKCCNVLKSAGFESLHVENRS